MSRVYRFAGRVFTVLTWGRMESFGLEHIPSGGFVLAGNHLSSMDPFILALPLWPQRQVRWMAKAELFNRVLGAPMRALGTFPIRRGQADANALRVALDLLRSGEVVGMFPEGTRATKGLRKKREARPHPGTSRIALNAGVPLVPAAIAGTDRLLRFGRLTVGYGPPVRLDDLAGMPRRQAAEIATDRLMEAIDALRARIDAEATASRGVENVAAKE